LVKSLRYGIEYRNISVNGNRRGRIFLDGSFELAAEAGVVIAASTTTTASCSGTKRPVEVRSRDVTGRALAVAGDRLEQLRQVRRLHPARRPSTRTLPGRRDHDQRDARDVGVHFCSRRNCQPS
jgi:hypothetical protein